MALAASGLASGHAFAAEQPAAGDAADAGGDAIVVTARRREENSQDVPVALSVVSADTLDKTGSFTVGQLQQLVPSLQVTATNPRNSNINIRGLGANSAIAVDGLEYGVGFYLDGVYYSRPGQSQFDLVDIQQIEVLRGPQGTLFGKNTTAGAVNITTRAPSFTPEFTGEASVGDHGYHQLRASASGPLVADKVALRLSIADTHRDGFLKNVFDGRKAQDYDNFSVRGQLLVKPTDTVSIRLIGDYSSQKQHFSLNVAHGYFTTFANGSTIANNIVERAARTGYTLQPADPFARRGAADAPFQANMKSYGVSGQVDWDLGGAAITSITAYRWWDWDPANDVDGTSLAVNTKGQSSNRQRQFSQELRIASTGTNTVDYVAGLYYFWQVVRGAGQNAYGPDYAAWSLPSTTPAATVRIANLAANGFEVDSFSNPETRSYAAFGQIDWHVTDALTVTGGLRYTHEDKKGIFTQYWLAGAGTDVSTLNAADAAAVTAFRNVNLAASQFTFAAPPLKDDAVGGLATLSYKVTPTVLAYATYQHGSKSGGLNLTAGGRAHPIVNPEKVNSYELGFKSQFLDRKLTVNGAAFLTEITDYQTSITESVGSGTTTTQYIANIPKVRSKGFEGDIRFSPSRWASFTASGAYTDAKYVTYTNGLPKPENLYAGQPGTQDLSGVQLPGVPKFSYALGADLAAPVDTLTDALGGGDLELYGHADYSHRSSFNATPNNSMYGIVPAYGIVNARIGLRSGNGRWDIALWARNLTNKNYFVTKSAGQGTSAASVTGLISGVLGDPRTLGATLRTKF